MANNICDCDLNTLRTQHSPQNNDSTAPIVGWLAFTMSEALLPKACGPDGTFDVTGDLIFNPPCFQLFPFKLHRFWQQSHTQGQTSAEEDKRGHPAPPQPAATAIYGDWIRYVIAGAMWWHGVPDG